MGLNVNFVTEQCMGLNVNFVTEQCTLSLVILVFSFFF